MSKERVLAAEGRVTVLLTGKFLSAGMRMSNSTKDNLDILRQSQVPVNGTC
ncbi:MAG: hypothetical protein K8F91_20355 [Candidatus Obscuribacterales bacterium]|nr:hypothetical protein [Candidatus Obscuribacterales bacterium]